MSRYKKYIKPYLFAFIMTPLMVLTEVFGEIWLPKLMAKIINNGIAYHDMAYVWKTGGVMFLSGLLIAVGGVLSVYFSSRASSGFSSDLRRDLFERVQKFSFANIDDFSTGSIITRCTNDVNNLQRTVNMALKMALRTPGMLIGALFMAVSIDKELTLVLLLVIPLLGLGIGLVMRAAFPHFGIMQSAIDRLNNGIQETLTNTRVVKSFVREDFEVDKFEANNKNLHDRSLESWNIIILNMPIMSLAMNATTIAIVWIGGNKIIGGRMLVGDLTAFITYITQVLGSLMSVAMIFNQGSRALASGRRINEILDAVPDISDENAQHRDKEVEGGSIEFRNVAFMYPETTEKLEDRSSKKLAALSKTVVYEKRNVLEGISFSIKSGETVGILGSTGSGKTSLVQLIPRLYDATEGEIFVDGINVKDYDLKKLRDGVAMVLQNNMLFSGTVEENLMWGDEDADFETVRAFAGYAQADGFISEFKEGYDTMIEQGGNNVSGGQKQRLCIARALLKQPKILILDDSTSAVDTATEAMIRHAFATTLKDTTKLIIAQRIGSVKDADKIIVMDDGKMVDMGSHEELIGRCEVYQQIYYSQVEKKDEEVTA